MHVPFDPFPSAATHWYGWLVATGMVLIIAATAVTVLRALRPAKAGGERKHQRAWYPWVAVGVVAAATVGGLSLWSSEVPARQEAGAARNQSVAQEYGLEGFGLVTRTGTSADSTRLLCEQGRTQTPVTYPVAWNGGSGTAVKERADDGCTITLLDADGNPLQPAQ